MGELIIHIDQESGAVVKVEQKLYSKEKKALQEKQDKAMPVSLANIIDVVKQHIVAEFQATERKISEWLCSKEEECTMTLHPMGNLYLDDPQTVNAILKHRDTFDRFIPLPVELWEVRNNTVCSMICGGALYVCNH